MPRPVKGRPRLIEIGWDPEKGTWEFQSPAGKFLAAVKAGAYTKAAAGYAGVNQGTLQNWVATGRDAVKEVEDRNVSRAQEFGVDRSKYRVGVLVYVDFLAALAASEASLEVELVTVIRAGCREDPKLALQFLGRKFKHWQEHKGVDLTVGDGPPLQDQLAKALASDPSLASAAEEFSLALARALPDGEDETDDSK